MSVARTPLSPALAAWLDGVGAAPEPVRRLQREMAGADDEAIAANTYGEGADALLARMEAKV